LNGSKIQFFVEKLVVLGHVVDSEGIMMDPHKVDAIKKWPVPTNASLLGSFIGAVGFLAPNCEGIRIPMGILTPFTGSVPWQWSHTEQRAFETVKAAVIKWRHHHRTTLDHSPTALPIFVVTDVCLSGASGVVCQGQNLDTARIIAFWSGKFNAAQQNYPVQDVELLAIVESLKRFRTLLVGAKFTILTGHCALEHFMAQKKLSPRQSRWLEALSEFNFTIQYIPGTTNILADALSRIYSADAPGTVRAASEYVPMDDEEVDPSVLHEAMAAITRPVKTGNEVFASLNLLPGKLPNEISAAAVTPKTKGKKPKKSKQLPRVTLRVRDPKTGEISIPGATLEGGSVPKQPKIPELVQRKIETKLQPVTDPNVGLEIPETIPELVTQKMQTLSLADKETTGPTDAHKVTSVSQVQSPEEELLAALSPRLTDLIPEGNPSMDIPTALKDQYSEDPFFKMVLADLKHYKNFELKDGLLFIRNSEARILCIPNMKIGEWSVWEIIISHAHSILAHLGARKTLYYLRDNVWWKSMIEDVKLYCSSCSVCAMSKTTTQKPYGLLNPLSVPTQPWQSIGIDFVGPLPASKNWHGTFDMILVIVDRLSSMVHLVPMKQKYHAKDIAEVIFEHVYSKHGLPKTIVSDWDTLLSIFWDHLHALIGTKLRMSSSYHPQTDGATEHANRTMAQMLGTCISPNQKDWVTKLPGIEFAMNSARSETTGYSPFYLNTGRTLPPMIWDGISRGSCICTTHEGGHHDRP
jgi:hypothetical protein